MAEKVHEWKDGNTPSTGTPALGTLFNEEFNNIYNALNGLEGGDGMDPAITADSINERTPDAGVNVEGVLLKDSEVNVDTVNEKTPDAGVNVEGVLLKDGGISVTSNTKVNNLNADLLDDFEATDFLRKDYSNFDSGYAFPESTSDVSITFPDDGPWLVIVNGTVGDNNQSQSSEFGDKAQIFIREGGSVGPVVGYLSQIPPGTGLLPDNLKVAASGSGIVNGTVAYIDLVYDTYYLSFLLNVIWIRLPNNIGSV